MYARPCRRLTFGVAGWQHLLANRCFAFATPEQPNSFPWLGLEITQASSGAVIVKPPEGTLDHCAPKFSLSRCDWKGEPLQRNPPAHTHRVWKAASCWNSSRIPCTAPKTRAPKRCCDLLAVRQKRTCCELVLDDLIRLTSFAFVGKRSCAATQPAICTDRQSQREGAMSLQRAFREDMTTLH